MRWLGRWFLRVLVAIACGYAGGICSRLGWSTSCAARLNRRFTVSQFMSVPLKGQKTEYDYLGTANVPCAVALFPQGGEDPCWYLRRNANQWEKVGAPEY